MPSLPLPLHALNPSCAAQIHEPHRWISIVVIRIQLLLPAAGDGRHQRERLQHQRVPCLRRRQRRRHRGRRVRQRLVNQGFLASVSIAAAIRSASWSPPNQLPSPCSLHFAPNSGPSISFSLQPNQAGIVRCGYRTLVCCRCYWYMIYDFVVEDSIWI